SAWRSWSRRPAGRVSTRRWRSCATACGRGGSDLDTGRRPAIVRDLQRKPCRVVFRPARRQPGEASMPDQTTTVGVLRDAMREFVAARQWEPFHSPKNLAMALAAEAAELMEHFLWMENAESFAVVRDPAR